MILLEFVPAGETQWAGVTLNRLLVVNDRLWSDTGSLVEMQLSGATGRLGSQTDLKIAQFQITQGTLILSN
ncbi:hypothetical protein ACTAZI_09715 [Legionella bozemanae]|uniref:hypothetical protein n=1 Tax=Legionella bozemanae TaxID=447 RepID=UPI00399D4C35